MLSRIHSLGHVMSDKGIVVDPRNVRGYYGMDYAEKCTRSSQLLDLVGYY
jgi:hypothetical protein